MVRPSKTLSPRFLGALFVGATIFSSFTGVTSAAAEVKTREVTYKDGDLSLTGYLAYEESSASSRPGVLVIHEWWGLNEYAKRRTRELAALGYVAFAADVYGSGKVTTDPKVAGEYAKPFYEDKTLLRRRLSAALDALKTNGMVDASRLAALGYCFGGSSAIELAKAGAPIKGVVSFHGGLKSTKPAEAGAVKGELLILNGEADPLVPVEERLAFKKEMDDAKVTYTFVDFSGALHAFTNPDADSFHIPGIGYQARADKDSWVMMKNFLERIFAR